MAKVCKKKECKRNKENEKFMFSDKYCDQCGEKLGETPDPKCICGSLIFPHEKYCTYCGKEIKKN